MYRNKTYIPALPVIVYVWKLCFLSMWFISYVCINKLYIYMYMCKNLYDKAKVSKTKQNKKKQKKQQKTKQKSHLFWWHFLWIFFFLSVLKSYCVEMVILYLVVIVPFFFFFLFFFFVMEIWYLICKVIHITLNLHLC